MTARMNVSKLAPTQYRALYALDRAVHDSATLPAELMELVKIRASQLNGCAFCVDMHSFDARKAGVSDARLFAVAAWSDGPFFSAPERAALALTEAMTRLTDSGERVSDEIWLEAGRHFDDEALANLVMLITTINAWNRIGVATRMVPRSAREQASDQ
jgi:AhpD family alkylhydroperoxidase